MRQFPAQQRHNPAQPAHVATASDRRNSERVPASDSVTLALRGTSHVVVGELRDLSREGFRADHTGLAMCSGDFVTFHIGRRCGTAQVVWTRNAAGARESGFLIVQIDETMD